MNKITIRGITYEVNPISKVYFRGLTECLADLGDVDNLSKSAKTIKKVIIPGISEEIITKGQLEEEFYIWHSSVDPEEINRIILEIGRCFRLQKLEEAKAKGDKSAIAEHQEGLRLIEEYLNPKSIDSEPIESQEEEAARLRSRLAELESRQD